MKLFKLILFPLFCFTILFPSITSAQTESKKDLNVSATVPADPDDFTLGIQQITSGSDFPQNTQIEYRINYSSSLSTSVNFKIEAQWYPGQTQDQQSTVNVADYVNGSATKAYGGAIPVIDPINNKIIWNISSFPPSTNGSVSFKLITNSNYQGSQIVTFDVKTRLHGPGFTTPDKTVQSTYKYSPPPTPTPSPTQAIPSPGPTSAPSPTPISESFTLTQINVRTVSDTSASIFTETNQISSKLIRFGTLSNALNGSVSSPPSFGNLLMLEDLSPNTTYFFRLYAINSEGQQIVSDIYTFKTASSSQKSTVDSQSFVATSNETILTLLSGTPEKDEAKNNVIILPVNTNFQFKFAIKGASGAKSVHAVIRSKNILGITNLVKEADASTNLVNMVEIEPGIFSGNLKSKPEPGVYEIYIRVTEKNGNISEQKISEMKVINKFTVISNKNKKPIEGARILFYVYNEQAKKYQLIPASAIALGNPVFTNKHGTVDTVLPQAKYKAEVSRLGYIDKSVKFQIGIDKNHNFPITELEEQPVSIPATLRYYFRTFTDIFLVNTHIYTLTLADSSRFFDLISFLVLTSLVILAFCAFSKRSHIPLSSLTSYFFYLKDKKMRNEKYIHGVVYDDDDKPLAQANVYLTDENDEEIISHSKTNKYGEFYFKKGKNNYLLMVMKKGYKTTPLLKYEEKDHIKFKINLVKDNAINEIKNEFTHIFSRGLGMLFEIILLLSFVFELLFINTFGFIKTAPFLTISIFNLLLWIMHIRHRRQED